MGRRLLALIVDWLLCALIASSLTGHVLFASAGDKHYFAAQYATLGLFVLEVYLLTAISGLTVGKRLLGIRAISTDGSAPGFKWAAAAHACCCCSSSRPADRPRPARPARPRRQHDRRPDVAPAG